MTVVPWVRPNRLVCRPVPVGVIVVPTPTTTPAELKITGVTGLVFTATKLHETIACPVAAAGVPSTSNRHPLQLSTVAPGPGVVKGGKVTGSALAMAAARPNAASRTVTARITPVALAG